MRPIPTRDDPEAAWPMVIRTAGVVAVLVATLVGALDRFVGVGEGLLVAGAVAAAVVAGMFLPPAAPRVLLPRPSDPPVS